MKMPVDLRRTEFMTGVMIAVLLVAAGPAQAKKRVKKAPQPTPTEQNLIDYIQQLTRNAQAATAAPGSLWNPDGSFSNLVRDYKAYKVGDLVTINIVEQTSAAASGNVKSARSFSASSGISAFYGPLKTTNHFTNLFSPQSTNSLDGQTQTSSSSTLSTSLTGTVAQVLPNGYLVVQADRAVDIDNQRQQVVVRGVVRPGDLAPDNSVPSTSVGNLEVEIVGKGVISDGTRPPNKITRLILKLVGF